jgi:Na+:H+ antiporter, NhaA family
VPLDPPGTWWLARWLARKARAPVERFLAIEASSGVILMLAALVALVAANSPLRDEWAALWHTPIGFRLGDLHFERDAHFWINDGLMTIFFFVVGLEIRREIHQGELSELRRALLPLAAAVGGMLAPAAIYLALNDGRAGVSGWGVPMATDIAFAVGVLALLGKRVPPALRVLLLALAVIDDVGAILVIALFYSSGFQWLGFIIVSAGIAWIVVMQLLGVRSPWAYVIPSAVVWSGSYAAGVHPTLAGVVVGLMTPVHAWFGPKAFIEAALENVRHLGTRERLTEPELLPHLDALNAARREAVSPVERLQHSLHPWVAYAIMPLFALANAGVSLGGMGIDPDRLFIFMGIFLGLFVGKPLGILLICRLGALSGAMRLPTGVTWPQVFLVGTVAGIGFTMSLFIAQLAFADQALLDTAKIAVLAASAASGLLGLALGRVLLRSGYDPAAAETAAEAEASTEL